MAITIKAFGDYITPFELDSSKEGYVRGLSCPSCKGLSLDVYHSMEAEIVPHTTASVTHGSVTYYSAVPGTHTIRPISVYEIQCPCGFHTKADVSSMYSITEALYFAKKVSVSETPRKNSKRRRVR